MQLVEENLVLKDYINSMIERENVDGTDMPIGVSIPHGNPIYVKETTVLVAKNKKKFKWKSYFIALAFVVVIAEKDRLQTRNILKDIYNLITDSQRLEEVRKVTLTQTLLELIIKK